MNTGELHALTGAYALDALEGGEREAFERHLTQCPLCAQEVRELSATAARLGAAVAVAPPPEMKDAVLTRIAAVRRLAPRVASPSRLPRLRAARLFTLAASVAAAVLLGGTLVWQYEQMVRAESRAGSAERRIAELSGVMAAPDARTVSGRSSGGGSGTVVVSVSRDRAAFLASGLPALPPDRAYQLWFADGDVMRSAGLVRPDGVVLLRGRVDGASGVGVSVEPSGGSSRPTTDPVLLLSLRG